MFRISRKRLDDGSRPHDLRAVQMSEHFLVRFIEDCKAGICIVFQALEFQAAFGKDPECLVKKSIFQRRAADKVAAPGSKRTDFM